MFHISKKIVIPLYKWFIIFYFSISFNIYSVKISDVQMFVINSTEPYGVSPSTSSTSSTSLPYPRPSEVSTNVILGKYILVLESEISRQNIPTFRYQYV